MSMLLDALKKSEEQRQLGNAPDIHSPDDHRPGGGGRALPAWIPAVLAIVSVTAMAWFGWKQFAAPETETPQLAAEAPPPVVETGTPRRESADTDSAAGEAAPAASRTSIEEYMLNRNRFSGTSSAKPDQSTQDSVRQDVRKSFGKYEAPKPVPESPGAQESSPLPGDPEPPAMADSQSRPATPGPAQPTQMNVPTRPEPYRAQTMTFWELPQGIRDSLPEFRITVLVYADDPDDRFLLINGVRMKEKDELQSGVVLHEIRRDGAVFRARNYTFLVRG